MDKEKIKKIAQKTAVPTTIVLALLSAFYAQKAALEISAGDIANAFAAGTEDGYSYHLDDTDAISAHALQKELNRKYGNGSYIISVENDGYQVATAIKGPNYGIGLNGYSVTEEDETTENTETDSESSETTAPIISENLKNELDQIKDKGKEASNITNEENYTNEKTPDEWVDYAILRAQASFMANANIAGFSTEFDSKEEVEALLQEYLAYKAGDLQNCRINDYFNLNNGDSEFSAEVEYATGRYKIYSDVRHTIEDLAAGDTTEDDQAKVDEEDKVGVKGKDGAKITAGEQQQDEDAKDTNIYLVIAALAAAGAAIAMTAAIWTKRGLSRGRSMRIAGTRFVTGSRDTRKPRKELRLAKKIAAREEKARKLAENAKTGNLKALKRYRAYRSKYLVAQNPRSNSLLFRRWKTAKLITERQVYAQSRVIKDELRQMRFLRTYSRRAQWSANRLFGRNKEYFADSNKGPTPQGYDNLMRGLNAFAKYKIASLTGKNVRFKSASHYLEQSNQLLSTCTLANVPQAYYGDNSIITLPDGRSYPTCPQRYIAIDSLGNQIKEGDVKRFFNDLGKVYPTFDNKAVFITVTYTIPNSNEVQTLSGAYDNPDAAKYLRAKLLYEVPSNATSLGISTETYSPRRAPVINTEIFDLDTGTGYDKYMIEWTKDERLVHEFVEKVATFDSMLTGTINPALEITEEETIAPVVEQATVPVVEQAAPSVVEATPVTATSTTPKSKQGQEDDAGRDGQ